MFAQGVDSTSTLFFMHKYWFLTIDEINDIEAAAIIYGEVRAWGRLRGELTRPARTAPYVPYLTEVTEDHVGAHTPGPPPRLLSLPSLLACPRSSPALAPHLPSPPGPPRLPLQTNRKLLKDEFENNEDTNVQLAAYRLQVRYGDYSDKTPRINSEDDLKALLPASARHGRELDEWAKMINFYYQRLAGKTKLRTPWSTLTPFPASQRAPGSPPPHPHPIARFAFAEAQQGFLELAKDNTRQLTVLFFPAQVARARTPAMGFTGLGLTPPFGRFHQLSTARARCSSRWTS